MKNFVNLHAHTNLGSMLDALIGVDELFEKVKDLGQEAVAVTDHGTLAAHLDAFWASKKTGIKFIPGCEIYYVNSYDFLPENPNAKRKVKKTEKRKHLVLLAQNHTGYKNLLRLNYIGFQNHVMVMGRVFPRINWHDLSQYTEGLICTSACANGPISRLIIDEEYDRAAEVAQEFAELFPDRFFIELHPHLLKDDPLDQDKINKHLINIANKYGIPMVAAIDTHYATREVEKYHDVLLAINAKKPVDDPTRHRYGIDEFYAKSGDEVYNFLNKHYGVEVAEEAVNNTIKIANMCESPDYMEPKGNHLPVFKASEASDFEDFSKWRVKAKMENKPDDIAYMRFKCIESFKKRFAHLSKEERKTRWERVKKELKILEDNNFSSYMLVVSDFIKWAKDNGILVGCGRGCLSGDTLVFTSGGFKKLKNVKKNDFVLTHKGRFRLVKNTFKYDVSNENLTSLKTDYSFGPIILTNDHEVFAVKKQKTKRYQQFLNNNWRPPFKERKFIVKNNPSFIPVSDLEENDFIFMPFPERFSCDIESLDLSEYCGPNDTIIGDKIVSNISLTNGLSIRKISKETGLNRGTIQRAKRKSRILNSTKNSISSYLLDYNTTLELWQNDKNTEKREINRYLECDEEFCYIMGRWIGDGWIHDKNQSYSIGFAFNRDDLSGKERVLSYFRDLGFKCSIIPHKEKKLDQLYVYSYILTKLLRDLFPDYQDKSYTKSLGLLKNLPSNKSHQIIMGVKHSDGHYNAERDRRENIDSTSINLINDIRQELLYLKIPSSVSVRKDHKHGEYLCRKSYKLRFRGLEGKVSNIVDHRIFKNGYFVKILKKDPTQEKFVYDIHVDEDNSYVTQNYAVHNSVGGSMIAYLLDIHSVDPIEYGLLFERFQNAYKKDLPDIDTDFTSAGRDLVKDYCKQKYGRENCAQVSNINTYTPKNVIPDLVKSMRNVMPGLIAPGQNYVTVSDEIKKAIPDMDENKKKIKTLEKAMEISPKLREFASSCPELMEYADAIVGLPKEYSTHAAGMVISDIPIVEFAPVRVDKNKETAAQYEKNRCESIGLVKMDFLAISTLDVIDETFKNIKRLGVSGPKQMEDIPLNDKETYKMIQEGYTKCVFQLGKSSMMVALCKLIRPKSIVDIAMVNALGRPSSSNEERKEYADRRFGKKEVTYLHPSLENSLKETYGLGIFEEQLMGVAQDVAGWDLNKADGLRKLTKLKGKNPQLALQLEVEFIEGSMKKHDISYEKAKEIWDKVVLPFAGYGFNKSHAVFYSINGYITAYLKCHYPAAFLAAYLKIKAFRGGINKDEEIAMAKNECRRMNIKIIPPDINKSGAGYEVLDSKTIVMGFAAIKGMGEKAINEIVLKQPFTSFVDFLYRVEARTVNKSKLEVLAKAGCFDSMEISRKAIYDEGKKTRDKLGSFLRRKVKDGYDSEMALDDFPISLPTGEWSRQELLRHEQEVLSELASGNIGDLFPGFFIGGGRITPISRLDRLPNREEIIVEFMVKAFLREFKIKKGKYIGQPMIKYRVGDVEGSETELTVWPSEYKSAKKFMKEGIPVRARCQISEFNGNKTLMLRSIEKVYGI